MESILGSLLSQYKLVLLMVLLGVMIRSYNYSKRDSKNRSWKGLFFVICSKLGADLIFILGILIYDEYVHKVDPLYMMILLALSENLLNWLNSNQERITKSISEKLLDILLEWLNNLKKSNSEKSDSENKDS